jgi:cytochrome c biogenesis protein CcmG, thiol:disulfide interchange protein DsbE
MYHRAVVSPRSSPFAFVRLSVLVVGVATIACAPAGYPPSEQHPLLGKPLPEIHHRETLDGHPFDAAQLAGKPVLVKFFAAYCQPCRETLPAAERLHESHPNVDFVGIDEDDSTETAQQLVQKYGLSFSVVRDESNVLAGRFRVSAMPATFVADSTGVIRWVGGEGQTEADLRRAIEAAR